MLADLTQEGARDYYRLVIARTPPHAVYRDVVDPEEVLDRARRKRTRAFIVGVENIIAEEVRKPGPDSGAMAQRIRELGVTISEAQQWADVLGQNRFLLELDERLRVSEAEPVTEAFASRFTPADKLSKVEFVEATQDIVKRRPEIQRGFGNVQDFYSREHGFALARSNQLEITKRVRTLVSNSIRDGLGTPAASDAIAELGKWARAYGETVFRTNLATAFSAGRMRQAFSPELDDFIPAFKRTPVGDADTRDNHDFELTALKRDPIWLNYSAPGGYNCRCVMKMVDIIQLRKGTETLTNLQTFDQTKFFNDEGFNKVAFSAFGLV